MTQAHVSNDLRQRIAERVIGHGDIPPDAVVTCCAAPYVAERLTADGTVERWYGTVWPDTTIDPDLTEDLLRDQASAVREAVSD